MITKLNEILKIKQLYLESDCTVEERWKNIVQKMESNAISIQK